ncbi:MAG: phage tail protein I [Vibrio sp.]
MWRLSMSSHHYKSVLPDNSSPFMRAVETAFRSQLEQVCEPYPNLLRANLTPRQFLAALAGESGVTDWFETDPDDEQRAIAGGGLVIQKSAGTRKGLKIAAESIGLDAVAILQLRAVICVAAHLCRNRRRRRRRRRNAEKHCWSN